MRIQKKQKKTGQCGSLGGRDDDRSPQLAPTTSAGEMKAGRPVASLLRRRTKAQDQKRKKKIEKRKDKEKKKKRNKKLKKKRFPVCERPDQLHPSCCAAMCMPTVAHRSASCAYRAHLCTAIQSTEKRNACKVSVHTKYCSSITRRADQNRCLAQNITTRTQATKGGTRGLLLLQLFQRGGARRPAHSSSQHDTTPPAC